MGRIFLISDPHFFHKNIILYENRPFKDVEEMNYNIQCNWNSVVKEDDKVFCLGDVGFANKEMIKEVISKLNGRKSLILGNHDRGHNIKWWQSCGFDFVSRYPIVYNNFYILSHEPLYMNGNSPYINIHGHIHSNSMTSPFYMNVSVERINYTPIDFELIKSKYEPKNEDEGETENESD